MQGVDGPRAGPGHGAVAGADSSCWSTAVLCATKMKQLVCFIPVYIVFGIIFADWYTFSIYFSKQHAKDPTSTASVFHWFFLVLFNISVVMLCWSYLRTIVTSSAVAVCLCSCSRRVVCGL
jgi:hypothetical protein